MPEPQDRGLQTGNLTPLSHGISEYIEPATIITLTIGAVYYVGWSYTNGYFERLGIQHDSLEFPTSFYLMRGFLPVLVSAIVVYWAFSGTRVSKQTRANAAQGNVPILLLAALLLLEGFTKPSVRIYLFAAAGLILVAFIMCSWQKTSLSQRIQKSPPLGRIFILLMLIAVSVVTANFLGQHDAARSVEGALRNGVLVRFAWKGEVRPELENKAFVLILHRDGKYYVVGLESPAPEFPKVYIVPDEQIKLAVIQRIN